MQLFTTTGLDQRSKTIIQYVRRVVLKQITLLNVWSSAYTDILPQAFMRQMVLHSYHTIFFRVKVKPVAQWVEIFKGQYYCTYTFLGSATQLKSDICSTNVPTFSVRCIRWCMCGLHSMKKSICKHELT